MVLVAGRLLEHLAVADEHGTVHSLRDPSRGVQRQGRPQETDDNSRAGYHPALPHRYVQCQGGMYTDRVPPCTMRGLPYRYVQ